MVLKGYRLNNCWLQFNSIFIHFKRHNILQTEYGKKTLIKMTECLSAVTCEYNSSHFEISTLKENINPINRISSSLLDSSGMRACLKLQKKNNTFSTWMFWLFFALPYFQNCGFSFSNENLLISSVSEEKIL